MPRRESRTRAGNMAEDHEPKGLGDVLLNLPAVRAAKKVNTLSRVHRRLIQPIDSDDAVPALAFQHSVFCQTGPMTAKLCVLAIWKLSLDFSLPA